MAKHLRKKAKKSHGGLWIAIAAAIIVILASLFIMPQVLYRMSQEDADEVLELSETSEENTESSEETSEPEDIRNEEKLPSPPSVTVDALKFPLLSEDGKLRIEDVLQYTGVNPDCNNQECTNAAAVTVTNVSDTYLSKADITLTTDDGDLLHFVVTDLPVGLSVIAFADDNSEVEAQTTYTDMLCEASYDPQATMGEDKISFSVDGTVVTLQNETDTEINEIDIYCHSTLGDQLFGGITYMYTVNNLPANGTAELDAQDCFLGLAEVVRIEVKE